MKTAIESAIKTLVGKAETSLLAHEAMHLSQAALNIAHAYAELELTRRENEKVGS